MIFGNDYKKKREKIKIDLPRGIRDLQGRPLRGTVMFCNNFDIGCWGRDSDGSFLGLGCFRWVVVFERNEHV